MRADSEQRVYAADSSLGGIYSPLDIDDATSSFAMSLRWGDTEITLDPMPVASGELEDVAVDTESTEYDMPGALDATWHPSSDGAWSTYSSPPPKPRKAASSSASVRGSAFSLLEGRRRCRAQRDKPAS